MLQPRRDPHRRNDGFAQATTRGRSSCSPSKRHSPQRSDVDFLGRLSGTPLGEKNLLAHSVYRPKHGLSSWIIDAHDEPRPQIADTPTVAFADGKYDPV